MLRINLFPTPQWIDLGHDVSVLVAPLTSALFSAARADPMVTELGEESEPGTRATALAKALGCRAILNWAGVGDAEGAPIDPSPTAISALLDLYPLFDAFNARYVAKGLLLSAEGNGSAPSPTGISAGAPSSAPPVPDVAPHAPRS